MTDLGSSPDLRDVQRVGRAFLRMRPAPDLPAVQRVGQAQEPALARPVPDVSGSAGLRGLRPAEDVWLSGLAELLVIRFPNIFNR